MSFFQFRQMMMSLDTEDDESDSEENIKVKPEEEEATPSSRPQEKENAPGGESSHAQHNNSLPMSEDQLPSTSSAQKTSNEIPKPKTPGGIVPQVKESASLPGLTVNMNVPVIPLKVRNACTLGA